MTDDELSEKKKRVRRRWEGLDPEGKNVKRLDEELKAHEGNPKAQESILAISSIGGSMMQSDVFYSTGKAVVPGRRKAAAVRNKEFTDRHPEMQELAEEFWAENPDLPERGKISAAARHIEEKKGWPFNTVRQIIKTAKTEF